MSVSPKSPEENSTQAESAKPSTAPERAETQEQAADRIARKMVEGLAKAIGDGLKTN